MKKILKIWDNTAEWLCGFGADRWVHFAAGLMIAFFVALADVEIWNSSSLTFINLGNEFDASKVSNVSDMFTNCNSLETITGSIKNLSISLSLSSCPLDHDSALRIINGLATVTTAQTLTLSSTTKRTLSATEKAVLINKGWTLA